MFTDKELILHQNEIELTEGFSSIMRQLQDEAMIPLGGMVRPEDCQRLEELNNRFKKRFVDSEEDDRQRTLHAKCLALSEYIGSDIEILGVQSHARLIYITITKRYLLDI